MDKIKIRNFQIFSILFSFIFGTFLHFTYKLSGENRIIALFSAINESVWEHLKLLFFPMLLTTILGLFYFKKAIPNFLCSKTLGILFSIFFTIVFFYTYTGVLGKNIAFIDISSFFIATILGEFLAYLLIVNKFKCNNLIAIIVLIILLFCFIFFTYRPPHIGLFRDPITMVLLKIQSKFLLWILYYLFSFKILSISINLFTFCVVVFSSGSVVRIISFSFLNCDKF